MKQKANLIAAGTFIVGLVGFQLYSKKLRAEVQGGAPVSVLVVTDDLNPGASLTRDNLTAVSLPSDYVDGRRIRAEEKGNLLGVAIQQKLQAGEGIVWSDIADGAAHKHLASLVAPGRRAYTLDSGVNPLGRLLRVADQVDVLLEANGETTTLLQRVLVLAVGGQIERDDALLGETTVGGSGVTLSVTPDQARKLLEAESEGNLRLALRNPEDEREEKAPEKTAEIRRTSSSAAAATKEIEHVR